jgi:replicative DNA helicase
VAHTAALEGQPHRQACDFILTGGYDPSMPNTRFIGATKNKIKLEGASGNPAAQVFFDADRARLIEPEEVTE